MKRILLKNGTIIDEDGCIIKNQNIYIENGIIQKITAELIEGYEETDCTGMYITPGFVNLHAHSPMNIFRGIAEDVTIDDWFNKKIFPYESKLNSDDIYWGTMLASAEMVNNGVTAFADLYFNPESVYKAVEDIGIRADIAVNIFGLSDDYDSQLSQAEEFIIKYKNKEKKINLRMGPHAPYTCPGEKLKQIVQCAKKLDVGIHIHVSETKDQVDSSLNLTGKTPFEVVYESGGFDINAIIAHGLWATDEDIKFINDNVTFAFCPKTYMKLSMGNGNIFKLKDKLNYSFGTDGAASSNSLNPLEQARYFALIGKQFMCDAENFNIKEIWKVLMRGHDAFNFNTGKVKEGYDADLLVWNLNMVNTYPVYDPIAAIIYSSDASNIIHTIINGEFLKLNGLLQINMNEIFENVKKVQNDIIERGKGKSKVNYS